MISIDTGIMRELVGATTTANNAITDAMEVLNRISTHNDWACKEKDAINEYTNTNKNKIKQLQENSSAFLSAITAATTEFETTETSIADMFSSVETMLGGILSVATGVINGNAHTGTNHGGFSPVFTDIIKDLFKGNDGTIGPIETPSNLAEQGIYIMSGSNDYFSNYAANNMTEGIALCNFEDIDLG